jgi:hypothetical protein
MSEGYRYHLPQSSLNETLVGLDEALTAHYAAHPTCPEDVQSAQLFMRAALVDGDQMMFNQLRALTGLAYKHGLQQVHEQTLLLALQEARRTLAMGDVFIPGADERQDLVSPPDGGPH